MTDQYIPQRRPLPLHAAAKTEKVPEVTSRDKAARGDLELGQNQSLEEFTISVQQVREYFRSKGLSKSKDTVQRWCRTGELHCQKSGVLGRYFTTEASLLALEKKLLPDMIAENTGVLNSTPKVVQGYAAEDTDAHSGMQKERAANATASSSTPVHGQGDMQLHVTEAAGVGRLEAEVSGLRELLKARGQQIQFLQEEIRSGRQERSSVVQISNRMLETLEAMAIGGRLERPKSPASFDHSQESMRPDGL